MSNRIFGYVTALVVILLFVGLVVGAQRFNAHGAKELAWSRANEERMAKYLGETVTIGGVPHTIISAHAYTWNKTCVFRTKAYDTETDIPEATIMALIAKAAKVEK